jgi:hypothetical protein
MVPELQADVGCFLEDPSILEYQLYFFECNGIFAMKRWKILLSAPREKLQKVQEMREIFGTQYGSFL